MAALHICLPLDDMTWGDLRKFIALNADKDDAEDVFIEFEPNGESVGLLAFVDPSGVSVNGE